jgi:hypothetical protein
VISPKSFVHLSSQHVVATEVGIFVSDASVQAKHGAFKEHFVESLLEWGVIASRYTYKGMEMESEQ